MKKICSLVLVLLFAFLRSNAQTVFWQEDFGSGCNQGMQANGVAATPTNNAWSVTSLTAAPGNGAQSNEWFISATDAGFPPGTCGSGCVANATLTNRTLHIGPGIPAPYLDAEAKYTITPTSNTNKSVISSTIDCSNWYNMVLSFNYFTGGRGSDYAELMCYDGSNWTTLMPLANTVWTCAPKAMWTAQSISLPPSANGKANVRIGFRWQNNSGTGSDSASIAIDDLVLTGASNAGIKELKWSPVSIKVFPNPANNVLNVEGLDGAEEIEISGITGEVIYSEKLQSAKSSVDINALRSGIYFVRVKKSSYSASARFVKE
jgi:hypothetical protein